MNNPASRLNFFLLKAVAIKAEKRLRDIWAEVFEVRQDNIQQIFLLLFEMRQLTEDTEKAIKKLDDINIDLYSTPFKNIKKLFSVSNLDQSWSGVKKLLDEKTVLSLKFCEDALSRRITEEKISNDELRSLQGEIEVFLNEIVESNIDDELREFIIEKLEVIRSSILNYRLRGARALKEGVERVVGAIVLNRDTLQQKSEEEGAGKSFNKFLTFVDKCNRLADLALKAKQIASPIITYLLGAGEGPS